MNNQNEKPQEDKKTPKKIDIKFGLTGSGIKALSIAATGLVLGDRLEKKD